MDGHTLDSTLFNDLLARPGDDTTDLFGQTAGSLMWSTSMAGETTTIASMSRIDISSVVPRVRPHAGESFDLRAVSGSSFLADVTALTGDMSSFVPPAPRPLTVAGYSRAVGLEREEADLLDFDAPTPVPGRTFAAHHSANQVEVTPRPGGSSSVAFPSPYDSRLDQVCLLDPTPAPRRYLTSDPEPPRHSSALKPLNLPSAQRARQFSRPVDATPGFHRRTQSLQEPEALDDDILTPLVRGGRIVERPGLSSVRRSSSLRSTGLGGSLRGTQGLETPSHKIAVGGSRMPKSVSTSALSSALIERPLRSALKSNPTAADRPKTPPKSILRNPASPSKVSRARFDSPRLEGSPRVRTAVHEFRPSQAPARLHFGLTDDSMTSEDCTPSELVLDNSAADLLTSSLPPSTGGCDAPADEPRLAPAEPVITAKPLPRFTIAPPQPGIIASPIRPAIPPSNRDSSNVAPVTQDLTSFSNVTSLGFSRLVDREDETTCILDEAGSFLLANMTAGSDFAPSSPEKPAGMACGLLFERRTNAARVERSSNEGSNDRSPLKEQPRPSPRKTAEPSPTKNSTGDILDQIAPSDASKEPTQTLTVELSPPKPSQPNPALSIPLPPSPPPQAIPLPPSPVHERTKTTSLTRRPANAPPSAPTVTRASSAKPTPAPRSSGLERVRAGLQRITERKAQITRSLSTNEVPDAKVVESYDEEFADASVLLGKRKVNATSVPPAPSAAATARSSLVRRGSVAKTTSTIAGTSTTSRAPLASRTLRGSGTAPATSATAPSKAIKPPASSTAARSSLVRSNTWSNAAQPSEARPTRVRPSLATSSAKPAPASKSAAQPALGSRFGFGGRTSASTGVKADATSVTEPTARRTRASAASSLRPLRLGERDGSAQPAARQSAATARPSATQQRPLRLGTRGDTAAEPSKRALPTRRL